MSCLPSASTELYGTIASIMSVLVDWRRSLSSKAGTRNFDTRVATLSYLRVSPWCSICSDCAMQFRYRVASVEKVETWCVTLSHLQNNVHSQPHCFFFFFFPLWCIGPWAAKPFANLAKAHCSLLWHLHSASCEMHSHTVLGSLCKDSLRVVLFSGNWQN